MPLSPTLVVVPVEVRLAIVLFAITNVPVVVLIIPAVTDVVLEPAFCILLAVLLWPMVFPLVVPTFALPEVTSMPLKFTPAVAVRLMFWMMLPWTEVAGLPTANDIPEKVFVPVPELSQAEPPQLALWPPM